MKKLIIIILISLTINSTAQEGLRRTMAIGTVFSKGKLIDFPRNHNLFGGEVTIFNPLGMKGGLSYGLNLSTSINSWEEDTFIERVYFAGIDGNDLINKGDYRYNSLATYLSINMNYRHFLFGNYYDGGLYLSGGLSLSIYGVYTRSFQLLGTQEIVGTVPNEEAYPSEYWDINRDSNFQGVGGLIESGYDLPLQRSILSLFLRSEVGLVSLYSSYLSEKNRFVAFSTGLRMKIYY